ncbi:uncharacterized protein [Penaeus vannamei]|uniref:uncharacterized protein n=1 Tax=Penaeus vannamei TaxID=6689 RepID=UPI00387F6DA5
MNENTMASVNEGINVLVDEKTMASVNRGTDVQVDEDTLIFVNKGTGVQVDKDTMASVNKGTDVRVDENTLIFVNKGTCVQVDKDTMVSVNKGTDVQVDENTVASVNGGTEAEVQAFERVNRGAYTHIDDKTLRSANMSREVTADDNGDSNKYIQMDKNTLESMKRSTDAEIVETMKEAVDEHTDVQEDVIGSVSRSTDAQVNSTTITNVSKCTIVKMERKVESTKPGTNDKVDKNTMESVNKCTNGQVDKNMNSATDMQVDEDRMGSMNRTIDIKPEENVEESLNTDDKVDENNEEKMNTDVRVDEHVEETLNTDAKIEENVEETLNAEDAIQSHNLREDAELDETSTEGKDWCTNPVMDKNTVAGMVISTGVVKVEGLVEDMNADQNMENRKKLLESADLYENVELENKTENINTSAEFEIGTDEAVHSKKRADVALEAGMALVQAMGNKDEDPVVFYDAIKPVFIVGSIIGLHTLSRKAGGKYTISPTKVFVATLGLAHSFLTLMGILCIILTRNSYYTQVMLLPMQAGCFFCFHAYILCISKSKAIAKYLSAIEENQLTTRVPCPWYFLVGIFTYSIVYTACVLLAMRAPVTHRIILLSPTLMTALIPSFVDVYVFLFVFAAGVGLERLTKDVEEKADWTLQEVKAVADTWLRIDKLLRMHNTLFSFLLFARLVMFMTQGMVSLFSLTTLWTCENGGTYVAYVLIPLLESNVRFLCVCAAGNYLMNKHENLLESLRAVGCKEAQMQHPMNSLSQCLRGLLRRMEASPLVVEVWGMERVHALNPEFAHLLENLQRNSDLPVHASPNAANGHHWTESRGAASLTLTRNIHMKCSLDSTVQRRQIATVLTPTDKAARGN